MLPSEQTLRYRLVEILKVTPGDGDPNAADVNSAYNTVHWLDEKGELDTLVRLARRTQARLNGQEDITTVVQDFLNAFGVSTYYDTALRCGMPRLRCRLLAIAYGAELNIAAFIKLLEDIQGLVE